MKYTHKTPHDVYLRAAKLVDSGDVEYSCSAISDIAPKFVEGYRIFFSLFRRDYFLPGCKSPGFDVLGQNFGRTGKERRENRVLALLFMHEIAKDL
jgi:hypothetical protein